MTRYSMWLTEPNFMFAEVAVACGVERLVLDLEHGVFPAAETFAFVAYCKARNVNLLAKVVGATAEAVQQAIDVGFDGVIIPHILGVDHAQALCNVSKFAPLGTRSYAGGRTVNYMPPRPDYLATENARIKCYPMIETPESLADVEKIVALPSVDGIFPGPTDLSISSGRGLYQFDDHSRADLARCAAAAIGAGKHWIMPAWSAAERKFAIAHGVHEIVASTQTMVFRSGIQAMQKTLADERAIAS